MAVSSAAVSGRQGKSALALVLVVAVALLGGCGGGGDKSTAKKSSPKCASAVKPKPRVVKRRQPPSFQLSPTKTYVATVDTTCGTFKIALDSKQAPITPTPPPASTPTPSIRRGRN